MSDKLEASFEREDRYIVIKRKHLSPEHEASIRELLASRDTPTVECAVVESDWPEYETVWKMIEARVTGSVGGHRAAMVRAFEASGWSSFLAEKQADIALSVLRTPTPEQDGEVERLRAAIEMALKCTPANSNFYDCGDPFEILREAYEASTPPAQPTADAVERALRAAKGRITLLAQIINSAGIEHNSDHPCATGHVLQWIDEALLMPGYYVMVPREATGAMMNVAVAAANSKESGIKGQVGFCQIRAAYNAMISAASPTGGE